MIDTPRMFLLDHAQRTKGAIPCFHGSLDRCATFIHSNHHTAAMNQECQLGQSRMLEALARNEDIGAVLTHLFSLSSRWYLAGAASCLVGCYQSARNNGLKPPVFDLEMTAFISGYASAMCIELNESLNRTDNESNVKQLTELASAVHWLREQGATWSTPTKPQHPVPIDVRITGLPARITDTKVLRDADMEIVSTTHLEQDVF